MLLPSFANINLRVRLLTMGQERFQTLYGVVAVDSWDGKSSGCGSSRPTLSGLRSSTQHGLLI